MKTPLVPISWGELIDKITILEIKQDHITAPPALANIERELTLLSAIIAEPLQNTGGLADLKKKLAQINRKLWVIEDDIRAKERAKEFDSVFIELARAVYVTNDERATVKRQINDLLQSELQEEKSYKPY